MIQAAELAGIRKRSIRIPRTRVRSGLACYSRFFITALFVGLLACLGLAMAVSQTTVAYLGYNIGDLKDDLRALQNESQRLELEIARLSSLERIEREATERLGMLPAGEVRRVAIASPPVEPVSSPVASGGFWQNLSSALMNGINRAEASSP